MKSHLRVLAAVDLLRSEHPSVDMKSFSPEIVPVHTPRHRNEIQKHCVRARQRDFIVRSGSRFFEMNARTKHEYCRIRPYKLDLEQFSLWKNQIHIEDGV